jgi:hypothetical protein
MFELSEDGKSPVPVHSYLYQCTGCKSVFMVYGKLKPTNSPLDEVPVRPRPLREIPFGSTEVQQSPPPGISLVAELPQKAEAQNEMSDLAKEIATLPIPMQEGVKEDVTPRSPGKSVKGTAKK